MLNKKIEYFITLAECLSFTQAAAAHSVGYYVELPVGEHEYGVLVGLPLHPLIGLESYAEQLSFLQNAYIEAVRASLGGQELFFVNLFKAAIGLHKGIRHALVFSPAYGAGRIQQAAAFFQISRAVFEYP